MNLHNCIKCDTSYSSSDVDAYYCEPCGQKKKEVAEQVDARFQGRGSSSFSHLQEYDEIRKRSGARFPSIKDLGISL